MLGFGQPRVVWAIIAGAAMAIASDMAMAAVFLLSSASAMVTVAPDQQAGRKMSEWYGQATQPQDSSAMAGQEVPGRWQPCTHCAQAL